jgi:hypothetical protein
LYKLKICLDDSIHGKFKTSLDIANNLRGNYRKAMEIALYITQFKIVQCDHSIQYMYSVLSSKHQLKIIWNEDYVRITQIVKKIARANMGFRRLDSVQNDNH